jgi:hypothetical protein
MGANLGAPLQIIDMAYLGVEDQSLKIPSISPS